MKLVDPDVYGLAEQFVADMPHLSWPLVTATENEGYVDSLAGVMQEAIEDWCAQHESIGVSDVSGRLIAPPQSTAPDRPSGVWDKNEDARKPVE